MELIDYLSHIIFTKFSIRRSNSIHVVAEKSVAFNNVYYPYGSLIYAKIGP